ncbi:MULTISPECIES: hypothetical protein [Paraburkholderia]|uniref:hypothetical protein n=1 Tax=Paraburkholderia TaxID=1822464 RepID=UPI0038BBCDD5
MAMSSAERQAAYRERHLKDENGKGERLGLVIDLHAKRALERVAACYGVTQRAMLERLLVQAEEVALKRAGKLPKGQADYYAGRLRLDM